MSVNSGNLKGQTGEKKKVSIQTVKSYHIKPISVTLNNAVGGHILINYPKDNTIENKTRDIISFDSLRKYYINQPDQTGLPFNLEEIVNPKPIIVEDVRNKSPVSSKAKAPVSPISSKKLDTSIQQREIEFQFSSSMKAADPEVKSSPNRFTSSQQLPPTSHHSTHQISSSVIRIDIHQNPVVEPKEIIREVKTIEYVYKEREAVKPNTENEKKAVTFKTEPEITRENNNEVNSYSNLFDKNVVVPSIPLKEVVNLESEPNNQLNEKVNFNVTSSELRNTINNDVSDVKIQGERVFTLESNLPDKDTITYENNNLKSRRVVFSTLQRVKILGKGVPEDKVKFPIPNKLTNRKSETTRNKPTTNIFGSDSMLNSIEREIRKTGLV